MTSSESQDLGGAVDVRARDVRVIMPAQVGGKCSNSRRVLMMRLSSA